MKIWRGYNDIYNVIIKKDGDYCLKHNIIRNYGNIDEPVESL